MAKILLLSILLVFVYQFDELVRIAHRAFKRFRHQKHHPIFLDNDYYVGTVLALAGMPLALNFLLISDMALTVKLLVVGGMFMVFSLVSAGAEVFIRRRRQVLRYQTVGSLVGLTYALAGFFQPILRSVPWNGGRANRHLGKLAFLLSLPAFLGFGFKLYFDHNTFETEYMKYLDALIVVMVGGAFISIIISFLERYLHRANLNLVSYVRIVTGLAITIVLFL